MRPRKVRSHVATSRAGRLVCPACAAGTLLPLERPGPVRCDSCGCVFDKAIVGTLRQIVALPDAIGEHACEECGHPEMHSLPDRVFHCPACRSEVLPIKLAPRSSGVSSGRVPTSTRGMLVSGGREGKPG